MTSTEKQAVTLEHLEQLVQLIVRARELYPHCQEAQDALSAVGVLLSPDHERCAEETAQIYLTDLIGALEDKGNSGLAREIRAMDREIFQNV